MDQDIALIQDKIQEIRGQRVLLDRDIAAMYGVETKVLKQAVKRNIDRFPNDFMFELNNQEFVNWRSQIVTSNSGDKMGLRYRPYAFTELGVAMLSSILRSPAAIQININIMRAFVALRQMVTEIRNNSVDVLRKEVNEMKEYMEDVFRDYNDMHEDTRAQLEGISEALAELQAKQEITKRPRKPIGFRLSK
ncbi:MAG: ORF6N domain-containing protein [Bacteroidales bacterium]|nr:ORF6N domain-containing protein [Bacteroidales bacterium]MCD8394478.1 ORF6N domain-containing protein [Bacteroidales bacterium]